MFKIPIQTYFIAIQHARRKHHKGRKQNDNGYTYIAASTKPIVIKFGILVHNISIISQKWQKGDKSQKDVK